jgi:uncharacterized protein (DUF433 family)
MGLDLTAAELPLKTDAGGVIRVGNTRVTLDSLVEDYETGASPEEIVLHYPVLALADVHATIAYYLRNKDAVEAYLREQAGAADQVRREITGRETVRGLRERLLARMRTEPARQA